MMDHLRFLPSVLPTQAQNQMHPELSAGESSPNTLSGRRATQTEVEHDITSPRPSPPRKSSQQSPRITQLCALPTVILRRRSPSRASTTRHQEPGPATPLPHPPQCRRARIFPHASVSLIHQPPCILQTLHVSCGPSTPPNLAAWRFGGRACESLCRRPM